MIKLRLMGTPGAGKSFSAKREITNAFFVAEDDIIIGDPETELCGYMKSTEINSDIPTLSDFCKSSWKAGKNKC